MQSYLVSALTVAATLGIYGLFSKYLPANRSKHMSNKTLAQLRMEYLGFDFKLIGLMLLMTAVFTFMLYQSFLWITNLRLAGIKDAEILIRPDTAILLLPAMFDGMLIAALLTNVFGKGQLGDKWSEFMAYYNLKYKFNYERAMSYVLRIIAILVIPLTFLSLDYYSAFGEKEVKLNGFLGFGEKIYTYTEVATITKVLKVKAPNGNILDEPHTVIKFRDGRVWSTRSDGFDDPVKDQEIVDLVIAKTRQQILEQEFAY